MREHDRADGLHAAAPRFRTLSRTRRSASRPRSRADTHYIDADVGAVRAGPADLAAFPRQDFEALYQTENGQAQMFTFFSALAIGIACMGLFGLASFTTERRTKEIGIRKTIGGRSTDIVLLISARVRQARARSRTSSRGRSRTS